MKKFLFGIREFLWVIASEVEDWLYPYRNQLTPEQKFEVRVKEPVTGEMWMVEELIEQMNQKVDKMQIELMRTIIKSSGYFLLNFKIFQRIHIRKTARRPAAARPRRRQNVAK